MFDKTYLVEGKTHHEYIPYEKTVTVNRAPTDESVKLLKEFEKEALAKIAETYFIESAVANGVVLTTYSNPTDLGKTFIVVFNLNGKKHTVKHNFEEWRFYHKDIEPTPEKLFADILREYIFNEILNGIKVNQLSPKSV